MIAKYIRLANILREQIKSNIHTSGRKLPTEEALSKRYGVSRQTVREALKLLQSEGLIEKRQGSGTYIAEKNDKDASNRIAILISSDNEYIYPELISDMRAVFRRNGYMSEILVTGDSMQKEREFLTRVSEGNYAGLIAEPVRNAYPGANPDLYEHIRNKGTSVLFVGGSYSNFADYVEVKGDDVYGGYLACKSLLKKNHRDVVCLLNRDSMAGLERYQGILMALNDIGAEIKDDMCTWYGGKELSALRMKNYSFLRDFAARIRDKASAVICMNDEVAYWLIKEMRSMGIIVPSDISVLSFDNSFLSSFDQTQISTLSHNAHELGRNAAQGLVKLMNGQSCASQKLSWHTVSRETDAVYSK